MLKWKSFIGLIFILSFIGVISDIYISEAEIQKEYLRFAQKDYRSYKRIFPESVSPKPADVQTRDAREEMKTEVGQERQLLEAEEKLSKPLKEKDRPKRAVGEPTKIYYKISVDDKLFISVWRAPDLSLEFIVGPDGYISFPLIGDIEAADRTLSELDEEITEKLRNYVNDPQVSVVVRQFAGDQVTIIGEVKNPGIYKFTGKTRLMSIVALANGFTDRAKLASIVIVREPEEPQKDVDLMVVNIKNIFKGRLKDNIEIKANDIIYVSRTFVSNVKEFYDDWIRPLIDTTIDYETYKSIRRSRHR